MTTYKTNHYIEVNEHQPLRLIVDSLESIGFKLTFKLTEEPKYVTIGNHSNFGFFDFKPSSLHDEFSIIDLLFMVRCYEIITRSEKCPY